MKGLRFLCHWENHLNRLRLLVDGVCVGVNETCTALALENESHYHYLVEIFLSKLTDSSARTLITLLGCSKHSVKESFTYLF